MYIYTPPSQKVNTFLKNCHLDFTKQKGRSPLLDNYCMGDYLLAGNKLFNRNWCNELLLIF